MVYSTRLFVFWCYLIFILFLCFFSPFSIAITSLGKKELILVLFVFLFDLRLFSIICFLFLLVSGKGCGFVIVALPGLFSYLFLTFFLEDRN